MAEFLNIQYPITLIFYFLLKIHKILNNPPVVPIKSGIGSLTSNESRMVNDHLRPHVGKLPTYLNDTTHLLTTLDEMDILSDTLLDALLVSIDVESLYSDIPHCKGIHMAYTFSNRLGTD